MSLYCILFFFYFIFFFFFFFQAEDGIRDHCVTGVQTCALPISIFEQRVWPSCPATHAVRKSLRNVSRGRNERGFHAHGDRRSEERRVGKECRSRGGA